MSKLRWDKVGERKYETGVSKGVLYPMNDEGTYDEGEAWNGLSAVNENPSGAEPNNIYADNIKYLSLLSNEDFGATVEAYTYPDKFAECDGSKEVAPGVYISQQERKHFGMSYVSQIGNDTKASKYGYKIHIVYNATAAPSEKNRQTINESPEAAAFSWELSTTPIDVNIEGCDPTAHLIVDSTKVSKAAITAIESALYGTDATTGENPVAATQPRLLMPEEVIEIINANPLTAG